jgi:CRISPR-associated endonuclease/helicase Cas3
MSWADARVCLLLLIACHDLGKACPGFQAKWPQLLKLLNLSLPRSPNTKINHAFVSQISLTALLRKMSWPDDLAELVADAVGCHHGSRASPNTLDHLMGDRRAIGGDDWSGARRGLVEALLEVFKPITIPNKQTLTGPDFMLLSGLTSFSDWVGSNEEWFPFGTPDDCDDLQGWFQKRRSLADNALDTLGWLVRTPLTQEPKSFSQVFPFTPRPLQQAVADAVNDVKGPAILLLEAPMGEGKTEAAFFAHMELQRRFGHRGLYVALPTRPPATPCSSEPSNFCRARE